MSRRVRNTAGTAEEAHPPGSRAGPGDAPAASWDTTFHGFSAEDRAKILELSLPAGIVYAQQLPAPKATRKPDDQGGSNFAPFLSAQSKNLPPNVPAALSFIDERLDRWQREAVQKALSTPEIFLLRGNPGSGKSRVVTEIIRQALRRGQRVLFLSRHSAAIDYVLHSLDCGPDNLVLRCLEPGETEQQIDAVVRPLLVENRVESLTSRAREAGNRELADATLAIQKLDDAFTTLPSVQATIDQFRDLDLARTELESKRSQLERELKELSELPETAHSDDPVAQKLIRLKQEAARQAAEADSVIRGHEKTLSTNHDALAALQTELTTLEPLRQAWAARSFWTSHWWKALLGSEERRRASDLANQAEGLRSAAQKEARELEAAKLERQKALERAAVACAATLAEERSRRESDLGAEFAQLSQQNDQLALLQSSQRETLATLVGHPLSNPLNVEQLRFDLNERRREAGRQLDRARQWLTLVGEHPQLLRELLIENTLLICATAAGWSAERGLASNLSASLFDFLILEDADQFSEAECAGFARLARRWIFVGGDQSLSALVAPETQTSSTGLHKAGQAPPLLFAELWNQLHQSPMKLPYSWIEGNNQIVCRLRPVPPEQRTWIEVERLADHPQIVLHILALPRSQPVVAEVVFPVAFTIEKAKRFILQELEELAIHASEGCLRWFDEHADRLVLQLANESCHHHATVDLAPGVRERLHPCNSGQSGSSSAVAWRTCCIEFDYHAGWRRNSAEDWIERHLGLRDLGRAVQLDTLHRHSAGLAAFVKSLLASQAGDGVNAPANGDDWNSEAIDFVAVPPSLESRGERGAGPGRVRSAGLELDLSDSRNHERLPLELRSGLPPQGYVNLAEAQAVVRHLEQLLQAQAAPGLQSNSKEIFVIALYKSQAEVIRRLVKNSSLLASKAGTFEIGVPGDFMHREAKQVLLSLTRSHTHRATPFGASTKDLLTGLTRAQKKLVVFGDYGALTKRAQWDGVLDRADVSQAARERSLVNTLLAHPRISIPQRLVAVGAEGQAP